MAKYVGQGRGERSNSARWVAVGVTAMVLLSGAACEPESETDLSQRGVEDELPYAPTTIREVVSEPPTTQAPPPPEPQPVTAPAPAPVAAPAPAPTGTGCHSSYSPCIPADVSDADCAGGPGNGPYYVQGPVQVSGPDPYDLDRDGNGVGCEG